MTSSPLPQIDRLPELVASLSDADAERFRRIYWADVTEGRMQVVPGMHAWVEHTFGSVASVERQTLVRVDNVVTGEGALFNPLRSRRPVRMAELDSEVAEALAKDPWSDPSANTPVDTYGRLENDHGMTAANVAKFDAAHSLVVFRDPDPLAFTEASIEGHLDLARRWLETTHREDPEARYPYVLWNCLWRSGGSIVHGHLQVALARGRHYARVDRLRSDAATYASSTGSRYFEDLLRVHQSLGLITSAGGVPVLAHLTPLKEREVLVLGSGLDSKLAHALFTVLAAFRDQLGVHSFNVGIAMPPLAPATESWAGFPVVARIVDRGPLASRTSDFGGMELYAASVIASDPFDVARTLQEQGR